MYMYIRRFVGGVVREVVEQPRHAALPLCFSLFYSIFFLGTLVGLVVREAVEEAA
jgi:hypothetical protein